MPASHPALGPLRRLPPFVAAAAIGTCAFALSTLPFALAGDPKPAPAPAPAPAQAPTPQAGGPGVGTMSASRLAALDAEIRHLEHHLTALRRARNDGRDGRAETEPTDDAGQRAREADLRSMREIARYEGARAKGLAAAEQAASAKDEAKLAETRTALDALDQRFIDALRKIDDAAEGKSKGGDDAGDPKAKGADRPRKAPSKSGQGSTHDPMDDESDD